VPMQLVKPLIIITLVAGILCSPPFSCKAKPLFEWPGAKKARTEKTVQTPAANQNPIDGKAGTAPEAGSGAGSGSGSSTTPAKAAATGIPKPPADPYWPEIDMPDTPIPKFVQPAASHAAPAHRAPVIIPDTVPDIIPDIIPNTSPIHSSIPDLLAPLETPTASPARASIHQSISEPQALETETNQTEPALSQTIQPTTAPTVRPAAVKKAVAMPIMRPVAQTTTTSAFRASELHRLAMREVSKAIHINRTPTSECIVIASDSLFDRDQATITPTGELALAQLVERVSQWSEHPVVIECHTDSFGFENYIRKLSQERADCLRSWFIQRNLLQDIQVKAVGVGKGKPRAPNQKPNGKDDLVAMAINRRVEIHVDKTKAVEVPVLMPDSEGSNEEPQAPPQESETVANRQNNNENSEFGDDSLILNQLPRLEDVRAHSGRTTDATSEVEKPPEQITPEKIRANEWEHKEFGLWRDN